MSFKMAMLRDACAAFLLVMFLAACPTGPHGPGTPSPTPVERRPVEQPAAPEVPRHEGRPYDVASSESLLTILAFRGGAFAKAGHNHVIAAHDLSGTVYVPDDVTHSTFELRFSVAQLAIDEPELRANEGADFPPDVPDAAKEGTRRNMLSEALLNGAQYPDITLECERIEAGAAGTATQAQVRVAIRGQTHSVAVPVRYELRSDRLVASGELAIKQSELGLTPFSAMMGALQVQDELHIRFHLVAHAAQVHGAAGT
ncbi:MAG: YceI family protein [Steroidobacteraceae bacterium]